MSGSLRDSAERHFQKTLSLMQKGKTEQALIELEKAEEATKILFNDPTKEFFQERRQINLKNVVTLGTLFYNMGRFLQAKSCYELHLLISQKLLENDPENVTYQSYVGTTLNNLGLLLSNMGRIEEAKKRYEKALEMYEKLLKNDPENVTYQSDVAMTLNSFGNLLWNMERIEEAKNRYEKALEMYEKLLENDPENVAYSSDVAMTLNSFGNLLSDMGRIEEAKKRYEKALEIYEKLLENDPENVTYQSYVGTTLNNLGNLLWNMGSIEEAKKRYEKALEMYEKLLETDPENVTYQSNVGMTLNNLGNLLWNMGGIEEAKNRYEKALEMYEKLLKTDPKNIAYQSNVGMTLNNLGNLLWNMGSIEEAKKTYEKALIIYEKLLKTDPENVAYQSDVKLTLNNLGALISDMGTIEEVEDFNQQKTNHIFLSYAYEDKEIAQKIVSKLAEKGITTFYYSYKLKMGDSLHNNLEAAISANDYLMVLLSPNSINSKLIQTEIEVFLGYDLANRDITLLPILISDCEIPIFLANYQYFDLRNNLNHDIEKLIDQIYQAPEIDFEKLNPDSFENLVYDLMKELKFTDIEREPKYFGKRPDFKAKYKYFDPFEREITETWIVEVKFYKNKRADIPAITQFGKLLSSFNEKVKGLLITNSQITSTAKSSIKSLKADGIEIRIIDGTEIKLLLLKHNKLIKKYFSDSKVRN